MKALGSGSPYSKQKIESVQLLGSGANLKFAQTGGGLFIELPQEKPEGCAFAFKIAPVDPAPETE